MSQQHYRHTNVTNITNSTLTPASTWTVTAYEVGAQVVTVGASTTPTVRSGHGFATNDLCLIRPGDATDGNIFRTVSGVAGDVLTISGAAVTYAAGDLMCNLGADTGSGTPSFDGSPLSTFSDMDGTTAITEARVTTGTDGEFEYWHRIPEIWELVRNSSGTVVELVKDVFSSGLIGTFASSDNLVVRLDGTSGKALQGSSATLDDTGTLALGGNLIADRIQISTGTGLLAGDFALSAGFGTTASVANITGTDARCRFTVTSAGTGQGADPTITITFTDGAYTVAPFASVQRIAGSQLTVVNTWTMTTTTIVITFNGTPIDTQTYRYELIVMG